MKTGDKPVAAAPGNAVYGATKAAVVSLTGSLAAEHRGKPVSINSISPGMVETDFYKEVLTRPELAAQAKTIRLLLNAVGVPAGVVGELVADVCAQQPGVVTGRQYSVLRGWRSVRGKWLVFWYGLTGKMK